MPPVPMAYAKESILNPPLAFSIQSLLKESCFYTILSYAKQPKNAPGNLTPGSIKKGLAKGREAILPDRLPDVRHKSHVVVQIVNRVQPVSQELLCHEQVPQIGS